MIDRLPALAQLLQLLGNQTISLSEKIMASRINTNMPAGRASRNLGNINNLINKNLEKLSSGLRINTAGDDASGLAISERMKAQLGGLRTATNNSNDAIALIQTADGALSVTNAVLSRIRELAVRSASDTVDPMARTINQNEVTSLLLNINTTNAVSKYNGVNLLDGTANLDFQIGANNTANDQLNLVIAAADTTSIGVDQIDVSTKAGAQAAIDVIDGGITYISNIRAVLGATQNSLERTVGNLAISVETGLASLSNIVDADMAQEMVDFTKNNVLSQAAQNMVSQANQLSTAILSLLKGN